MNQTACPLCNHPIESTDKFCPGCGKPLSGVNTNTSESAKNVKTITSSGNYSGEMVKSKTSRGWKIFRRILIALIILGIVALVIWFKVDPDAGKKLIDTLLGIAFMIVFLSVALLFKGRRRGKSNDWDSDQFIEDNYDNDDDD